MALDIPVVAEEMFEYADRRDTSHTHEASDDYKVRYQVAIACYILLSRLADLSVRAKAGQDEGKGRGKGEGNRA